MRHNIIISIFLIFSVACATFSDREGTAQQNNLTAGMVKANIIKGKTNQAEILQLFGAPNIITKNRNNNEVWNYNRMSFKSYTRSDGVLVINWAGSRTLSTSVTSSFDLILIFDDNDVVIDYSVISARF